MTWVCLKWGTQTSLYHHVPYENCRFWGSRCIESPAYSRYVLATCWTMTITGGWGGAGLYCCATCTYLYIIILYIYAYIHNSIFIMSIIHIYVKISKSMDASRISADSPRPFCGRSTARTSLELCERFAKLVHSMTDDSSSQVVRCLRPTSANANFKDSLCLLKQRHGVIHPRIGSLSHFDTFGCLPAFNQPLKTEDTWTVKPQEWVCNP